VDGPEGARAPAPKERDMNEIALRNLGRSGLRVSVLGLGCSNFGGRLDERTAAEVVGVALDHGITTFDTADIYCDGRSEEILGAAIARRRDDVVLATKCGNPPSDSAQRSPNRRGGSSRHYIVHSLEQSLRRLGTDYVDLYQMHQPDPETPIEETLSALDDVVRAGKVRYVGTSNFSGWQIADAAWTARTSHLRPFVSAQNHYSLLRRQVEEDVIPACEHFGVGLMPWFPLASGMLTGKYRRDQPAPRGSRMSRTDMPIFTQFLTDENFDRVEALEGFAAARDVTLPDVAYGWLAAQPSVACILSSASSTGQVAANAAAAMAWAPDADDLAEIDRIAPRPTGAESIGGSGAR
jgi:aryl-alcohol dehydrogenase-like predicted oxidoreductase